MCIRDRTKEAEKVTAPEPKNLPDRPINVLILGSDSRGEDGGRSDSMILLRLDFKRQFISQLSFPRDLWIDIPGRTSRTRISSLSLGPDGSRSGAARVGLRMLPSPSIASLALSTGYHLQRTLVRPNSRCRRRPKTYPSWQNVSFKNNTSANTPRYCFWRACSKGQARG